MQLTINIKNNNTVEKILWMLEHFKSDGVEIIKSDDMKIQDKTIYSDEYIEKNWRELVSKALSTVDADADDWKMEYGTYLADKNR
ncbi:MAG: hypothetical protein L0Y61_08855 [Epsilonproteobacteria bacterium]|nr:hypothetical protein [Campylobacterota bacterium]